MEQKSSKVSIKKPGILKDSSFQKNANMGAGTSIKTIADGVKFVTEPLPVETNENKLRKRRRNEEAIKKQLAIEDYNREMHEQRYKRLMHLLDRSQFYSSYLEKKISSVPDDSDIENKNLPKNGKKAQQIMMKSALRNVKDKLTAKEIKLNLSDEDIAESLNADVDTIKKESVEDTFHPPKYFNGILYGYQEAGLQWLKVLYEHGINGILADEMGLGKTIQVIALLCHLIEKEQSGPYLIIAPLSTIPNWIMEFEKFAPKLPVILFYGPAETRAALYKKIKRMYQIEENYKTLPIVITTYETPFKEHMFLRSQRWRYIIIDEGHRIKNSECQLKRALDTFKSMNRLLLTGTPLQNDLAELWSLLNFLLPDVFDDLAVFEAWFDVKELGHVKGTENFLKQEEEKHVLSSLREILKPFMLRREKADVTLDVPLKKEVVVYAPLTQLQHDLYKAVLTRDLDLLTLTKKKDVVIPTVDGKRPKRKCTTRSTIHYTNTQKVFNDNGIPDSWLFDGNKSGESVSQKQLTRVDEKALSDWQQYTDITDRNRDFFISIKMTNRVAMYKRIVNHPYLVHYPLNSVGLPKVDDDLIKSSGKLLVLDAMLAKLKSNGHKVLLFSTMTMILDMIEDYLTMRDYRYVRLDGASKMDDRKENIKNFNTDPDVFLFLISTRAGGVGLNLAAADTVILYDSDWNPQADIQAMARCHRIGQTRPVVVYRLCTKGTIDEAIISRAEGKRILEKIVISKQIRAISFNSKESLMELKKLLDLKEYHIVTPEHEVFTEAELKKLLDRNDISMKKEISHRE